MEKVTIRLAKSLIGRGKEQIAVAHSLGLNRPGEVTEQPDNAATQGLSLIHISRRGVRLWGYDPDKNS